MTSMLESLLEKPQTEDDPWLTGKTPGSSKPLFVQDFCNSFLGSQGAETVLSANGDALFLVTSAAKRVRPEDTTWQPWVKGHARVFSALKRSGQLESEVERDRYTLYGNKFGDMCQHYRLANCMRYDYEYRQRVASDQTRWGDDDTYLLGICCFSSRFQESAPRRQQHSQPRVDAPRDSSGMEICRNFNSRRGCRLSNCRFSHACLKCHQNPEFAHRD